MMENEKNILRSLPDAPLVKLCMEENRLAQDVLTERYGPLLLLFLLKILRRQEDAEEVLQNTWLIVLLRLNHGAYREQGNFNKWIQTIAFRQAQDFIRKKYRLTKMLHGVKHFIVADLKSRALTPISMDWLMKAVESLSPQQKEIVSLRLIKDMPIPEIATQLGITCKAVSAALSKAIAKLRKMRLAGW
jgi:RNA polymerase sigma factor (sigma-70 family)